MNYYYYDDDDQEDDKCINIDQAVFIILFIYHDFEVCYTKLFSDQLYRYDDNYSLIYTTSTSSSHGTTELYYMQKYGYIFVSFSTFISLQINE